ncbi:MAG TPA: glycoside hydrolase family 6 protein, partial [Polyangia bacterium]
MNSQSRILGSLFLILGILGTGCSDKKDDNQVGSPSGGSGGPTAGSNGQGEGPQGSGSSNGGNGAAGGAGSSSSSAPKACLDTPRAYESCENAKQWGFCGQAWFAGNCEITCGVCTPGTSTPGGTTVNGNGSGTSTSGNGNSGTSTPGNGGQAGSQSPGNGNAGNGGASGSAGSSGGSVVSSGTGPIKPATTAARVDNPYLGATGYINPEWKARAEGEPGGSRVSNNPTGVWMDRIAAIKGVSGGMGLRDHLNEALAQKAGYIQFVIYDLPGRDCAALASNGELGPTDIERYKKEYIDPIASTESDPKYADLRIINIIEIDSLPNLVTNTGSKKTATPNCDVMKANGNYQKGIAYALGELYKAGNTYNYIDAGHHGWIG